MRGWLRTAVVLLVACSSAQDGPVGDEAASGGERGTGGDASGGSEMTGGSQSSGGVEATGGSGTGASGGDTGGVDGGSGDAAMTGDAEARATALFEDPDAPVCDQGSAADFRLRGTLDGQVVDYDGGWLSSNWNPGSFYELGFKADRQIYYPLEFFFEPAGPRLGEASALVAGKFEMPEGQPGAGQMYCITEGTFGPAPLEQQANTAEGILIKFQITGVRGGENCAGEPVAVRLSGCLNRTDSYLPPAPTEPSQSGPTCSPMSERYWGEALDHNDSYCNEPASLVGLPNPSHLGTDRSLQLAQPLQAGKTYAVSLVPSGAPDSVIELWGQSEACGAVDELLWAGTVGDGQRQCAEFTPAQDHTHLLRVTRGVGFSYENGYTQSLVLCGEGRCSEAPSGQGAAPGKAAKTVWGTYELQGLSVEGGAYLFPLDGGAVFTFDAPPDGSEVRALLSGAFRAGGPYLEFEDVWYCASGGTRAEPPREPTSYEVTLTGLSRMPRCDALAGSDTWSVVFTDAPSRRGTVSSSLPGFEATGESVDGFCYADQCRFTVGTRDPIHHVLLHVDGDMSDQTAPFDVPIRDALLLTTDAAGTIRLGCDLGGRVRRDPTAGTTTVELTGLGPLAECGTGTPATPSTRTFRLK